MRAGLGSGAELPPLSPPVHPRDPMGSLCPICCPQRFLGSGISQSSWKDEGGASEHLTVLWALLLILVLLQKNISMGAFWLFGFFVLE